jgi:hypothetical protein
MTAYPHINSLSSTYQDQIAHLMYYTAEGIQTTYGCSGTGSGSVSVSSIWYADSYLGNLGYDADGVYLYHLPAPAIKSSIFNNRPVIVEGLTIDGTIGHAWVIDGYQRLVTIVTYVWDYYNCLPPVSGNDEEFEDEFSYEIYSEYVHFN